MPTRISTSSNSQEGTARQHRKVRIPRRPLWETSPVKPVPNGMTHCQTLLGWLNLKDPQDLNARMRPNTPKELAFDKISTCLLYRFIPTLDLSDMALAELPPEIQYLEVRKLILTGNGLEELPASIRQMRCLSCIQINDQIFKADTESGFSAEAFGTIDAYIKSHPIARLIDDELYGQQNPNNTRSRFAILRGLPVNTSSQSAADAATTQKRPANLRLTALNPGYNTPDSDDPSPMTPPQAPKPDESPLDHESPN